MNGIRDVNTSSPPQRLAAYIREKGSARYGDFDRARSGARKNLTDAMNRELQAMGHDLVDQGLITRLLAGVRTPGPEQLWPLAAALAGPGTEARQRTYTELQLILRLIPSEAVASTPSTPVASRHITPDGLADAMNVTDAVGRARVHAMWDEITQPSPAPAADDDTGSTEAQEG